MVRRRRRDRVDCRFVWPAKLDARLAEARAKPRKAADEQAPAPMLAPLPVPAQSAPGHGAEGLAPTAPVLWLIVCGTAAACAFVVGRVATGGAAVFGASLAAGLAILVTFAAASVTLRSGNSGRTSVRRAAVLASAVALTALMMAGAGALRPD